MKRVVFTGSVLLWMAVIFWFSAQPAEESTDMSETVGQKIGAFCFRDFASWSEERQIEFAERIDYPVRKCAHATEYAVLAALLIGMLGSYGLHGRRLLLSALAITVFYAGTDEFHQLFVEGRACMLTDVLIDACGGTAVCLFCCIGSLLSPAVRTPGGKRADM